MGNPLVLDEAWKCSRYDYSWPQIVNYALGSTVKRFQFEACSGDRTAQIHDQVDKLEESQDVVMLTAGGNDLCLVSLLMSPRCKPY
jgi:lysophospholipase L1-like esterase